MESDVEREIANAFSDWLELRGLNPDRLTAEERSALQEGFRYAFSRGVNWAFHTDGAQTIVL